MNLLETKKKIGTIIMTKYLGLSCGENLVKIGPVDYGITRADV